MAVDRERRAATVARLRTLREAGSLASAHVRLAAAEQRLGRAHVLPQRRLGRDELAEITHRLGDMVRVLSNADPIRKA
ncbi:hypothetical protein ABZ260_35230, partial [Streptosporangium sp. NPDC006013]|uniref:hypothetical protein n=1 Tax=Streptosporangium sp. NPDC006013 TaxID=3155596 RepID=UPI0033A306FD